MIPLSTLNYPCLEQISMVPEMFKPLRFDGIILQPGKKDEEEKDSLDVLSTVLSTSFGKIFVL